MDFVFTSFYNFGDIRNNDFYSDINIKEKECY